MGKAIICDIDGVLVDNSLILNHIKSNNLVGEEKWKYINSHINGLDTYPNRKMMELIKMFYLKDFKIILLTARSEEIREQTIRTIENDFFLLTDLIIEFDIYMRKLEDYDLKPHEIKQKYLDIKNLISYIKSDLN